MNAGEALAGAVAALRCAGVPSPRLDAELLLSAALGTDRGRLLAHPEWPLRAEQLVRFDGWVARRAEREPVAYLLGTKPFRRLELAVDARVLIPRPETEHLVEAAAEALPQGARVADVGTGSGAVALALADERPDLSVVATDASADALAVARANAERLGLAVELVLGDLLEGAGAVDAVVSNPPYVAERAEVDEEVWRFEPGLAVYGGADGLAVIRRLVPAAAARGARLLALEVGEGQAAAAGALAREAGFGAVRTVRDLAGIERVVVAER